MTDHELIAAYQGGDRQAFNSLYRRYNEYLIRFVLQYPWITEDRAKDVVQNVWMSVIRFAHTYSPDHKFSTWLFTIAKNAAKLIYLRTKRDKNRGDEIYIDDEDHTFQIESDANTAALAEYNEQKNRIDRILSDLSPEFEQAVRLRDFEGYTYIEMQSILDVPMGTVKSRINRGRNQIKELYAA